MHITSVGHLEVLSKVDQSIYDLLSNWDLGRRAVSDQLGKKGFQVSDKLVRTWRENHAHSLVRPQNSIQFVPDNVYPFNPPFTINPDDDKHTGSRSWTTTSTSAPVKPTPIRRKADKDKRVIAFGDFQINKHDPEFLAKTVRFVKDQQPDIICLTGDESDNSAVGRWAKGQREEFESNLQSQIDETVDWLRQIREAVPNAEIEMAGSNHMEWITRAVETRLPGFATLRALTPEVMYELKDLEINYHRKIIEFLPNFLLAHGHQWGLTSASHRTKGLEQVMRTGHSILAGHTHQAALETAFIGYEGKGEQKVYVNAGCIMDFEKAMESNGGYIGGTSPNWSKGLVVITRENKQNYTELVLGQNDGTFRYEGKIY